MRYAVINSVKSAEDSLSRYDMIIDMPEVYKTSMVSMCFTLTNLRIKKSLTYMIEISFICRGLVKMSFMKILITLQVL